jgi:hypothetical protein
MGFIDVTILLFGMIFFYGHVSWFLSYAFIVGAGAAIFCNADGFGQTLAMLIVGGILGALVSGIRAIWDLSPRVFGCAVVAMFLGGYIYWGEEGFYEPATPTVFDVVATLFFATVIFVLLNAGTKFLAGRKP